MSVSKSNICIILAGGIAALTLGAALAASAQIKAPGNGKGPVTPPEDPGMCMAKHVLDPNKWTICGVTPPQNRNITVINAQGYVVRARFTMPSGTTVDRNLASGQQTTIPIGVNENATITVASQPYVSDKVSKFYTVRTSEHGSGNISITAVVVDGGGTCTTAP